MRAGSGVTTMNRKQKSPKKSRNSSSHSKEHERLNSMLLQEETSQLQGFINARNKELDQGIKSLHFKLQKSKHATEKEPEHIEVTPLENVSLEASLQSTSSKLYIQGSHIDTTEQPSPERYHYRSDYDTSNEVESQRTIHFSKEIQDFPPHKDDLVTLLARIKLKMEDVNMSPATIKDFLLPSDLTLPGEYHISLKELIGVLQTDLLMPVTESDQVLLLQEYANNDGDINARYFLADVGVWHDDHRSEDDNSSPRVGSCSYDSPRRDGRDVYSYSKTSELSEFDSGEWYIFIHQHINTSTQYNCLYYSQYNIEVPTGDTSLASTDVMSDLRAALIQDDLRDEGGGGEEEGGAHNHHSTSSHPRPGGSSVARPSTYLHTLEEGDNESEGSPTPIKHRITGYTGVYEKKDDKEDDKDTDRYTQLQRENQVISSSRIHPSLSCIYLHPPYTPYTPSLAYPMANCHVRIILICRP